MRDDALARWQKCKSIPCYQDVLHYIAKPAEGVTREFMVDDNKFFIDFAKILKASNIDYAKALHTPATLHKDPGQTVVWGFPVHRFLRPSATIQGARENRHVFVHGSTEQGALGIIKAKSLGALQMAWIFQMVYVHATGFYGKAIFAYTVGNTSSLARAVADFHWRGKNQCPMCLVSAKLMVDFGNPSMVVPILNNSKLLNRYPIVHSCPEARDGWCMGTKPASPTFVSPAILMRVGDHGKESLPEHPLLTVAGHENVQQSSYDHYSMNVFLPTVKDP